MKRKVSLQNLRLSRLALVLLISVSICGGCGKSGIGSFGAEPEVYWGQAGEQPPVTSFDWILMSKRFYSERLR